MKKLILSLIVCILAVTAANAQNLTQKYNSLLERTEFYDSYSNLQGLR